MHKITNYIKIHDKLSTAGQPTKKQFDKIAQAGFDVVINLAMHNKGALKKEDKIVSKNGMIYIHIPVTWKKPEKERLRVFFEIFHALERANKKIFLHCILNHRASVFLYLYYRDYLGVDGVRLVAPKDFNPNKVWRKFMKQKGM